MSIWRETHFYKYRMKSKQIDKKKKRIFLGGKIIGRLTFTSFSLLGQSKLQAQPRLKGGRGLDFIF